MDGQTLMDVTFEIDGIGIQRAKHTFRRLADLTPAVRMLEEVGDRILDRAEPLTPMETGALRESGYADSHASGAQTVLAVGYGRQGDTAYSRHPYNYASVQHDRKHVNYTTPGTDWKFLERAMRAQDTADDLARVFRGEAWERWLASLAVR